MSHSPPDPLPERRSVVGTVLFLVIGVVLLLPGLCSLWFMAALGSPTGAGALGLLWFVCVAISIGGIVLIVRTLRR
jgi:hypothetical protein